MTWKVESAIARSHNWWARSQYSVTDCGHVLQAKKTRLRHIELDQRNEDHLAMLQVRKTEDEPAPSRESRLHLRMADQL